MGIGNEIENNIESHQKNRNGNVNVIGGDS